MKFPSSPKTTICGLMALIGPLVAQYYPEYAAHGNFIGAVGAGAGLLFARDNNVTSEQAGLTPAKKVETAKPNPSNENQPPV
jgi:hypothetical protein